VRRQSVLEGLVWFRFAFEYDWRNIDELQCQELQLKQHGFINYVCYMLKRCPRHDRESPSEVFLHSRLWVCIRNPFESVIVPVNRYSLVIFLAEQSSVRTLRVGSTWCVQLQAPALLSVTNYIEAFRVLNAVQFKYAICDCQRSSKTILKTRKAKSNTKGKRV